MNNLTETYYRVNGANNMYTLVIGRAFPAKETGMMGIFEFEQAAALKKNGMDTVYLFCDTRSIKLLRKLNYQSFTKHGVPVYGYHFPIGGIPRKIFDRMKLNRYKRLLREILDNHGKPSYIHIHFPLLTLNEKIWFLLKKLKIPVVVTEHWSKVQRKEIEPYRIDLLKKILEESSQFIVVGKQLKKSIIELTNSGKKIKIIPNMISNDFKYVSMEKTNTFIFIAIGRLTKEKNYEILIRAFDKAFKNNNKVVLKIVGEGPERAKLKKLIKKLGLDKKVYLKGALNRKAVAKELQKSDAYVSASELETFGVPYIESLACGKPIIGKENGVIEYLVSGKNGFVYNSLDELEEVLLKIYLKKEIYNPEKIARNINNQFGSEKIANELISVYSSVDKV